MQLYKNRAEKSGVLAYEIRTYSIVVRFVSGEDYEYTYQSAGRDAVEAMKRLATAGRGLSTYISQQRPLYARKRAA